MNSFQQTKIIHLTSTYFQAIKTLQNTFTDQNLKIQFEEPNRILIYNWTDDNPTCINFKNKFDKTLESISVIKLNLPEKKILRIKSMKKWKKQFEIQALNIFTVKRNYGINHYLIGYASQLQLYQVLNNLQIHSYKTFPTNFIKFLYKTPIELLINSKEYQITAFDKLKITSTEFRIIEIKNQQQKRGKFLEMFFQLEKYAPTKELVTKYKEFLKKEFNICGLVIIEKSQTSIQNIKKTLSQNRVNAWKYIEKKNEDFACFYVVCRGITSSEIVSSILDHHPEITFVKFLKGLGKGNQVLQPLIGNPIVETLTRNERYLYENFNIKGNSPKAPNEISISLKNKLEASKWIEAMRILF